MNVYRVNGRHLFVAESISHAADRFRDLSGEDAESVELVGSLLNGRELRWAK